MDTPGVRIIVSFVNIRCSSYYADEVSFNLSYVLHNLFYFPFKTTIDHQAAEFQSTALSDAASVTYEIPNSHGDYMPLHPSTKSWEISREQVDIIKNIGKGAFSQVAKASAKNIYGNQGIITVAVKMLKGYRKLLVKETI